MFEPERANKPSQKTDTAQQTHPALGLHVLGEDAVQWNGIVHGDVSPVRGTRNIQTLGAIRPHETLHQIGRE